MNIKLIQINESGEVAERVSDLPAIAQEVCASTVSLYQTQGFQPPWTGYLAFDTSEVNNPQIVGTCAFTSPPTAGTVEIAYFTFPSFEGCGYATAMAKELISCAQKQPEPIIIRAHTLPHSNASTSVLKKLGFEFRGPVMHPEDGEVWLWELQ